MANQWFQFKQFTIQQDQCAMKVGTDGVLLGAWTDVRFANRILDVGTGTGLIALILAQRNTNSKIDSIEIEALAAKQAQENILNSPFSERIYIKNIDYQTFTQNNQLQYDLIVSNPPFFKNSYQSKNQERNTARHTDSLSYETLLECSLKNLSEHGRLSIIIPFDQMNYVLNIAQNTHLFPMQITKVYPTLKKDCKRVLLTLTPTKNETVQKTKIIIEPEQRHQYSKEYRDLVKDFYLKID